MPFTARRCVVQNRIKPFVSQILRLQSADVRSLYNLITVSRYFYRKSGCNRSLKGLTCFKLHSNRTGTRHTELLILLWEISFCLVPKGSSGIILFPPFLKLQHFFPFADCEKMFGPLLLLMEKIYLRQQMFEQYCQH